MQKITPFLWFNNDAEEAVNFYVSIFKNSKIVNTSYYTTETPSNMPIGSVLTVVFEIEGQEFQALNGGPFFKFNESVSFVINCDNQEEVDYYWNKLSSDPKAEQCGWLKDKFGVSWQIIPKQLAELISKDKSGKVMETMLNMKKIEISKLEKAYKEAENV